MGHYYQSQYGKAEVNQRNQTNLFSAKECAQSSNQGGKHTGLVQYRQSAVAGADNQQR